MFIVISVFFDPPINEKFVLKTFKKSAYLSALFHATVQLSLDYWVPKRNILISRFKADECPKTFDKKAKKSETVLYTLSGKLKHQVCHSRYEHGPNQ